MTTFSMLFLAILAATIVLRLWLGQRHIGHVQAHRPQVPAAFAESIPLQAHQKAADYTIAKTRLTLRMAVAQAVLLVALTLGGGLQALDTFWAGLPWINTLMQGALVIVSAILIGNLIELPFAYYKTFTVDQRFGFNRMTPRMFFGDTVKHTLIGAAMGAPILFAALWLMQAAGDGWWLYLWVVWSAFNLLMLAVYPTFIAPLFNRFVPLQDEALKQRVETLLHKCGFESQGLFVMDGSARSSHGNAYFTGFGKAKRVVFFDTLLSRLSGDEIEAVLAHELGHYRHRHVFKRIAMLFGVSFAGLALLGWLANQLWFYSGLGVSNVSHHMALALFMLVSPVFLFLLQPMMSGYARSNEFEADAYAAAHANAGDLVHALVKLYRDNASTLTPDPLHSAYYDSHPSAAQRIARLQAA